MTTAERHDDSRSQSKAPSNDKATKKRNSVSVYSSPLNTICVGLNIAMMLEAMA